MTDTDFEARLARSLQARAEDAVTPFDASVIADAAIGGSRPLDRRLQLVLAAAVVALAVVTAGAIVVGSGLLNPRPSPPVIPSPQPDTTPRPDSYLGGGLVLAYRPHESAGECSFGSLAPFEVLSIDPGTGAETVLGTAAEGCSAQWLNFQWAADRQHVLMTAEMGQTTLTLDTATAAGRDVTFICCDLPTDVWEGGSSAFQGWVLSPAGNRVAAIHTTGTGGAADGVVVANIDGTGRKTLLMPDGAEVRGGVSWAPDQSALVIAGCLPCNHAQLGQPATAENHEHLYVVPVDGSPVQELLDDTTGWFWTTAWSPDAATFATLRRECLSEWVPLDCSGEVTSSLVLIDAETGSQRVAVTNEQLGDDLHVGTPLWSRDSTRVAFTAYSAIGDPLRVFVVDADGTNVVDLGQGTLIQWSPDGDWLLVSRQAGESFIDLRIVRPDGSDARSLGTFLSSFTTPAAW